MARLGKLFFVSALAFDAAPGGGINFQSRQADARAAIGAHAVSAVFHAPLGRLDIAHFMNMPIDHGGAQIGEHVGHRRFALIMDAPGEVLKMLLVGGGEFLPHLIEERGISAIQLRRELFEFDWCELGHVFLGSIYFK